MLHVVPVEASELPAGQAWLFIEVDGELYVLRSRTASPEALHRGWQVAQGLLLECAERRRLRMIPGQRDKLALPA